MSKPVVAGVAIVIVGIAFLVSGDLGYYEHNLAVGQQDAASHCYSYMTSIGCPQPPAYIPPIPYDRIVMGIVLVLAGTALATAKLFKRAVLSRI